MKQTIISYILVSMSILMVMSAQLYAALRKSGAAHRGATTRSRSLASVGTHGAGSRGAGSRVAAQTHSRTTAGVGKSGRGRWSGSYGRRGPAVVYPYYPVAVPAVPAYYPYYAEPEAIGLSSEGYSTASPSDVDEREQEKAEGPVGY